MSSRLATCRLRQCSLITWASIKFQIVESRLRKLEPTDDKLTEIPTEKKESKLVATFRVSLTSWGHWPSWVSFHGRPEDSTIRRRAFKDEYSRINVLTLCGLSIACSDKLTSSEWAKLFDDADSGSPMEISCLQCLESQVLGDLLEPEAVLKSQRSYRLSDWSQIETLDWFNN